jgi:hypothetical protein
MSRACKVLASAAVISWIAIGSAQSGLVVRKTATHNVSCSGGVCTATAGAAVMNVTDLTNMLAS